jgi:hypothetical protein
LGSAVVRRDIIISVVERVAVRPVNLRARTLQLNVSQKIALTALRVAIVAPVRSVSVKRRYPAAHIPLIKKRVDAVIMDAAAAPAKVLL